MTSEDRPIPRGAERRARNESIFRDANEEIQSKAVELGLRDQHIPFICECDAEGCTTLLRLTDAEYEQVRAGSTRFLLAHGHDAAPDRIVEEHREFVVVEKQGEEARLVAERDPRVR